MNTQSRWVIWVMMLQATFVYPILTVFLEPVHADAILGLLIVGAAAAMAAVSVVVAQLKAGASASPAAFVIPLALGEAASLLAWVGWFFGAAPLYAFGGMALGSLAVLSGYPRASAAA